MQFDFETLLWIAAGLYVYFFPTFIAWIRDHADWKGVFFVNFLGGWTIVMWFVIIIWALDPKRKN